MMQILKITMNFQIWKQENVISQQLLIQNIEIKYLIVVKRLPANITNVAKKYFASKQEDVEIIKLEGSVELGPVTGISDAIVDLVETGSTLKANGLEVIEKVSDIIEEYFEKCCGGLVRQTA